MKFVLWDGENHLLPPTVQHIIWKVSVSKPLQLVIPLKWNYFLKFRVFEYCIWCNRILAFSSYFLWSICSTYTTARAGLHQSMQNTTVLSEKKSLSKQYSPEVDINKTQLVYIELLSLHLFACENTHVWLQDSGLAKCHSLTQRTFEVFMVYEVLWKAYWENLK